MSGVAFSDNDAAIFKAAKRVSDDLWSNYQSAKYLEIAREIYPIAVDGIEKGKSSYTKSNDAPIRATNYPQEMLKQGATGFSVNLTSPAHEWFELGHALTLDNSVQQHALDGGLERLTDAVREVLSTSGFYRELDKAYEHLLAFGTACLLILPVDNPTGFDFLSPTCLRFGTYALGAGADGMINRCSRKFVWTPIQIAEQFGVETLPPDWQERIARGEGNNTKITVYNLIEPNRDPKHDEVSRLMGYEDGWRSIYWAQWQTRGGHPINNPLLSISKLPYRPIIAPRLEREAGDIWGHGRGEDALPLARALNAIRKDLINISGNIADPALFLDASLQGQPLRFDRGSVIYYNGRDGIPPSQPAIPVPTGFQAIFEQQQDIRNELSDVFLVSRFATINALRNNPGVKTATEIEQLVRENMGLLGPIVTNLEKEFLDPLVITVVHYTLDMAEELGYDLQVLEPVLDPKKAGDGMQIRYVGEVHAAMRASNINAIRALIEFSGGLMQATQNPEVADVIDTDATMREFADASGVKVTLLKEPELVEEVRGARAQQMQQQAQAEMEAQQAQALKAGAGAVKDISQTPVGAELMGGM